MSYKVNTATTEEVLAHLKKCNDQFVPSLDKKVNLKSYAEKITAYATRFEAWDDNELTGLVAGYFNSEKKELFITNVSVMRQYSGKGIASQLITDCIGYAKADHFRLIHLRVAENNKSAIGLYSKFGFKQTGHENNEVMMKKELES